jgi:DNA-directed RNA polymerase II subunit RPB2
MTSQLEGSTQLGDYHLNETRNISRATIDAFFDSDEQILYDVIVRGEALLMTKFIPEIIKAASGFPMHITIEDGIYGKSEHKLIFADKPTIILPRKLTEAGYVPKYPRDARLDNSTYEVGISIETKHVIKLFYRKDNTLAKTLTVEYKGSEAIQLCTLPVCSQGSFCNLTQKMQNKSPVAVRIENGEDPYDTCPVYIINGKDKATIIHKMRADMMYLYKNESKKNARDEFDYSVEIKSKKMAHENGKGIIIMRHRRTKQIMVQIGSNRYIKERIPLGVVFRALGAVSAKQIIEYIIGDPDLYPDIIQILAPSISTVAKTHPNKRGSSDEYVVIRTQEEAQNYIAKLIANRNKELTGTEIAASMFKLIHENILPHCGTSEGSVIYKLYYLGYMVRRLCFGITGREIPDNIDSTQNKAFLPGCMIWAMMFRELLEKQLENVQTNLKAQIGTRVTEDQDFKGALVSAMHGNVMVKELDKVNNTGIFAVKASNSVWKKVPGLRIIDMRGRADPPTTLRKSVQLIAGTNKKDSLRSVKPGDMGFLDPLDSPDGEHIGIMEHLAIFASISLGTDPTMIIDHLKDHYIKLPDYEFRGDKKNLMKLCPILVNNIIIGFTDDPHKIELIARAFRRQGLDKHMSVVRDFRSNTIKIMTGGGRLIRPVFVVENGKLQFSPQDLSLLLKRRLSFNDMLSKGIIEYIDTCESEANVVVCPYIEQLMKTDPILRPYTHCDIHPAAILSVTTSATPGLHRQYGPRIIFMTSQKKQAIAQPRLNLNSRSDKILHFGVYNDEPIVKSIFSNKIDPLLNSGYNCIVAVMPMLRNQEDSIILNKHSTDTGLCFTISRRAVTARIDPNCHFMRPIPNETIGMTVGSNYSHLLENGQIPVGTYVEANDIVIGKVEVLTKTDDSRREKYRDLSEKTKEAGIVSSVRASVNGMGEQQITVMIESARHMGVGDKMASDQAQKGICAEIVEGVDMYFMKDGTAPDLIINPHAFPTRMTMAMITSMLAGKLGAYKGKTIDDTPFELTEGNFIDAVSEELEAAGLEKFGRETLFNGITGEKLEVTIFVGVAYYQKLKQMVRDKIYARGTGLVEAITRQPVPGRSREGALRCGEMETWACLAHGAANSIMNLLVHNSDPYDWYVCNKCHFQAHGNKERGTYYCNICGTGAHVNAVKTKFAARLVSHESATMNIYPQLHFWENG